MLDIIVIYWCVDQVEMRILPTLISLQLMLLTCLVNHGILGCLLLLVGCLHEENNVFIISDGIIVKPCEYLWK